MKKYYIAPEVDVVILNAKMALLSGSTEKEDITDGPTPTIDDPSEDDIDW